MCKQYIQKSNVCIQASYGSELYKVKYPGLNGNQQIIQESAYNCTQPIDGSLPRKFFNCTQKFFMQ